MHVSSRGVVRSVVLTLGGLVVLGGCSDREAIVNQQSPSCTQAPGYVVFAHHSLWLRAGSTTTGKVGVRDATSRPYVGDNAELTVGLATG